MTQPMQNKTAVVTGATSGIGRACVVDFAKNGVNVVASGRREDHPRVQAWAESIE